MHARILVVEDDDRIIRLLERFLGGRGYEMHFTDDCNTLAERVRELSPDVVLLDWMLPGGSGIDALRDLRKEPRFSALPVIMLTARDEEIDRVEGLLTGADDYVGKPFSLAELEARILTVMRRNQRRPLRYENERLYIDPDEKRLSVDGTIRTLNLQEWLLLGALLRGKNAFSREELVEAVWGRDHDVSVRTIDVMILKLRRMIEPDPRMPCHIITERGSGYRFVRL